MKIDELSHVFGKLHTSLLFMKELRKQGWNINESIGQSFEHLTTNGDEYLVTYEYETDPDCYMLTLNFHTTSTVINQDISNVSVDPDWEMSIEYKDASKEEFYVDDIRMLLSDDYIFQQSTVHDVGNTTGHFWNVCYYHMNGIFQLLKGDE